jgi:hypothetical protein
VLTVNGTVIAPTINVWSGNAQLVVSGANAKVESNWIDIWDGTPSVAINNGATIQTSKIKVSRGGEITVTDANLIASESIEVGHNGNSAGKLTESGNSTITGEIKMTATASTVASDGGLNVTTDIADHKVVFDEENKQYKVVPKDYKVQVGAYLKPQLNTGIVDQMEKDEIVPSYGYLVTRGLADAIKRLVRDSGLGAKVYVDRLPFAGKTFDLGKELDIDPISAALNGGEDYRLLFTIPIGKHDKFRHDFQTFDIIGHLAKPEVGAALVTPDGVELPMKAQGWK